MISLQNSTTQVTTLNIHSRVLDLKPTIKVVVIETHCLSRLDQLIQLTQSLQTIIIREERLEAGSHKVMLLIPD